MEFKQIKDEEYHAHKAISSHGIIEYMKSPKKYEHKFIEGNNKATKSMSVGTYLHKALLEPNEWEAKYTMLPDLDRRTKEYKEAVLKAEAEGKTGVPCDDWILVQNMKKAVMMNQDTSAFFYDEAAKKEQSLFWNEIVDDGHMTAPYPCKARFDLFNDEYLVDIKTVKNINPMKVYYACRDYGYLKQMAWYNYALTKATGIKRRVLLLCVETTAPHEVGLFEINHAVLEHEFSKIALNMPKMAYSLRNNHYPSLCKGISQLWTPAGYWEEIEANEEEQEEL